MGKKKKFKKFKNIKSVIHRGPDSMVSAKCPAIAPRGHQYVASKIHRVWNAELARKSKNMIASYYSGALLGPSWTTPFRKKRPPKEPLPANWQKLPPLGQKEIRGTENRPRENNQSRAVSIQPLRHPEVRELQRGRMKVTISHQLP